MSKFLDEHDRLRRYIGIDLLELGEGFIQTPRILEECGELAAKAEEAKNIAKHNLDLATAEAANRIRQPWIASSTSQARIDSELRIMVPLAPEVIEARNNYTAAIFEADLIANLHSSLKEQGRLLGKASDLVISGYISPAALQDRRRAEYREARNRET